MNNNPEDQDIKFLLQEAYQSPTPDPAFIRGLGERLKHASIDTSAEVGTRPVERSSRSSWPARRWGWIAIPAAAAAVVLFAVGVYFLSHADHADQSPVGREIAQADIGPVKHESSPAQPPAFFPKFHLGGGVVHEDQPVQPQAFFHKPHQHAVAPKRPPLVKEPVYQSKTPQYAVLAFGPKAEARVWLVLDLAHDPLREKPGGKDSLYIDRNGNGDLTDRGERIPVSVITSTHFDWIAKRSLEMHLPQFMAGDIVISDSKITKYTGLTVDVGWFVAGQQYRWVALKVNVSGRGTQSVSSPLLRFADKPADAPVIHFDGPLALRLNMSTNILHHPVNYTDKKEAAPPWYEQAPLVRGEVCELTAEVGTPGVGPGTFALMTADIPPSNAHPVALVEFRHRDAAKPATLVKVELTQRCCGTLFKGKVQVPEDVAVGKAKVSLAFPGWADGNVLSTDAEVTVVDPPKAKSSKEAAGKADLSWSEQEKAAAEKVVAQLTNQDIAKLSKEELIRLATAYNELDDATRALDAINRIPESYLAEKGKLIDKAILLANVSSSPGADNVSLLKELAFLDRCIDRRRGNPGLWYWRKAKLLCRNSVLSLPNVAPSIVDREQFEHAYETLKRAFEVEPNLLALDSVRADRRCSPQDFPILNSEPRFKKLMEKPGRPRKLARVIDPSPDLRRELSAFDAYRHGSEERFVELERKADGLLKKYTAPDDQARIYYEVAHVAAQSHIRNHVKRVRRYAAKCLALSRDPIQRGMLYGYLGSAAEVEAEKTFDDRRRQAAKELLTGFAEMLAQELPAKAPLLPVVDKLGGEGIDPNPVEAVRARARHTAQMAARQEAEFIAELVDRRDMLANQLRWMYHPDPRIHGRNPDGPEELKALAGKMLNDSAAVKALLARVTEP
jgi:hypothetical protein